MYQLMSREAPASQSPQRQLHSDWYTRRRQQQLCAAVSYFSTLPDLLLRNHDHYVLNLHFINATGLASVNEGITVQSRVQGAALPKRCSRKSNSGRSQACLCSAAGVHGTSRMHGALPRCNGDAVRRACPAPHAALFPGLPATRRTS